jgi:hypothetical protein
MSLEPEILRTIKTYYDVQKLRIAVNSRVAMTRFTMCPSKHTIPAKEDRDRCPICGAPAQVVEVNPPEILREILRELESVERKLYREIERLVKQHPLWTEYLQHVKGVGPTMAAYLIAVLNPARFETVSKMWKYCGLHVVDGRAPRRVAGQKADWNLTARTMMWRLGEAFRMQGGFYKHMYRVFFEESLKKHPDWTKAHHLAHARRVTVKLFLAHYHYVGRQILGLPVRLSYICEKQPHQCIPPVVDDPEYCDEFYEKYVKKHFSRELYDHWLKAAGIVK